VLFKIFIVLLLAIMIYNLFRALFIMHKRPDPDQENQPSMTKFIGRRLMVSVAIVAFFIIGLLTGLITPNPRPF
jgi:uncharacterized membrane protein YfcA